MRRNAWKRRGLVQCDECSRVVHAVNLDDHDCTTPDHLNA